MADAMAGGVVTVHELSHRIGAIVSALVTEADVLPGTNLAYGRPHDHGRIRHEPRFSRTGVRLPGSVLVRPDCPRPVKGRCACKPDGSWRPVGGAQRADLLAVSATFVRTSEVPDETGRYAGEWTDALYRQGPDGLWRCTRPMRRAFQRLQGDSVRRYLVMSRILGSDRRREALTAQRTLAMARERRELLEARKDATSQALALIQQRDGIADDVVEAMRRRAAP